MLFLKPAPEARETRFEVTLPEGVEFSQYVFVSPDGHKLVFKRDRRAVRSVIRDLETLQWRKLAGTEGSSSPFWSPDSRYLGFSVRTDLKKIDVAGGPPQTLCTVTGTVGTGSWSKENVIIFGGKGSGTHSSCAGRRRCCHRRYRNRCEAWRSFSWSSDFLADGKHFVHLRVGTPDITGNVCRKHRRETGGTIEGTDPEHRDCGFLMSPDFCFSFETAH
jgi:hypothetical protein